MHQGTPLRRFAAAACAAALCAGLAGCEAALYLAKRGVPVTLYEQKPHAFSPAHN